MLKTQKLGEIADTLSQMTFKEVMELANEFNCEASGLIEWAEKYQAPPNPMQNAAKSYLGAD